MESVEIKLNKDKALKNLTTEEEVTLSNLLYKMGILDSHKLHDQDFLLKSGKYVITLNLEFK